MQPTDALSHDKTSSASHPQPSKCPLEYSAPPAQAGPKPGNQGCCRCSWQRFPSCREGRGVSPPGPVAPAWATGGGRRPVLDCRAPEVSSQRQSQAARGRQLGYRAASVTGPVTVSGLSALLRRSLGVGRIPQRFSCPSPGLHRSPPHIRAQENPTGD